MRALMTALVTVAVMGSCVRAFAEPAASAPAAPAVQPKPAAAPAPAVPPAAPAPQPKPAAQPTRIAFEAARVGGKDSTLVCVALVMTGPTNTVIPAGCLDAGTAKKAAAWTAKPAAAKGGK